MLKLKAFEIKKSKRNGQFRAYAIGLNGKKVFWSEHYERDSKALKAIRLLDPDGTIPVDYFDANGNWLKRTEPKG